MANPFSARNLRPRAASKAPPPPDPAPPLIGDTGNVTVDALGDVINNVAAPFQNAPDPEKGALGVVEQGIGAVMGVVGAPFELLDTGFAMITAPLAALVPGMPAAVLGMPHLGPPHGHLHPPSLVPPNPVPVPLPSIGAVMLSGCVSVFVGGIPAARAGDVGLAPTCVGLAPAFDIYTGSSNTWIGGSRAARMADITWHCNPGSAMNMMGKAMGAIGVAAGAIGAGASLAAGAGLQAAMQAAQAAADAAALAMSALLGKDPGVPPTIGAIMLGNPTVLIGGFPMPDVLAVLGGLMKGLKALAKTKAVGKALSKLGLCNAPGEPVHPYTGEVYNDFEDYVAVDSGFRWTRYYTSAWNEQDGPFGFGYRHGLQHTLTFLRTRAIYETHDGERVILLRTPDGRGFEPVDGFRLQARDARHDVLRTDDGAELVFERRPTHPPTSRLIRYRTAKADVHLRYDPNARLGAIWEHTVSGGFIDTTFSYDANDRITTVERGLRGHTSIVIARYRYEDGCLVEVTDAHEATKRFCYDAERRMVKGTDRRGYSFHWEYDPESGRCIKSHGDDGLWGIEANYEGGQSVFTEPNGGQWTYKHDLDGVLTHVLDPVGRLLQYVRNDAGRVVKQVMPSGLEYEWLYDLSGRHIGRRDAFGHRIPPEALDSNPPNPLAHQGPETPREWLVGRPACRAAIRRTGLSTAIDPTLRQATAAIHTLPPGPISYDRAARVLEQRNATGHIERFRYDPEGNVTAHQDARGQWWTYNITSWNKQGARKSPSGAVVRYDYTHREMVSVITDGNGNRVDYVRDGAQQITQIVINGTPHIVYTRDAHGSVVEERDAAGNLLVEYETNPLGLHTSATLTEGETYTYAYDAFGQLIDASSSAHEVTLQHRGRQQTHDLRDGRGVVHTTGSRGLRSRARWTTLLERFAIAYHNDAGVQRITTPDGAKHGFWRADEHTFVRENGNGTIEASVFDRTERMTARIAWVGDLRDPPVWHAFYRYGAGHDMAQVVDSDTGQTRYAYDVDGRLIQQNDPDGTVRHYAYDAADNLLQTPFHHHIEPRRGNHLGRTHRERYGFDARGRMAKRESLDGTVVTYIYDSHDQLIEVRWTGRSQVWRAAYDGLGRRIWREYGGKRTEFYWDGDRLAAEVAPDGALRIYVYANEDALAPFMWLDYANIDADPSTGTPYYLFCAPTGLPVRVEDQHRRVVWRPKAVDAYGHIEPDPSATVELRLRFCGHFADEFTGLFYNRFRDYDPTLGRYLQPDPLGQAGGINLYAYPSNPLVWVDLRGLVHISKKGATPLDQQNGTKRPTGMAEDPEVKQRRAAELEPRKDLPRGEDGLITKDAAKAECERLLAVRRRHATEDIDAVGGIDTAKGDRIDKQMGPVFSVSMDRRTGETFHGHNSKAKAPKRTTRKLRAATNSTNDRDGTPPKNVDPVLGQRISDLENEPRHFNDDGALKSNPGAHAEVYGTDAALKDRQTHNATVPADQRIPEGKDALPEITTVQQGRETGNNSPCCAHCGYITHGTDQASGLQDPGGSPPPD